MSSRTQFRVTNVSPVSAEVGLFIEDDDNYHYDDDDDQFHYDDDDDSYQYDYYDDDDYDDDKLTICADQFNAEVCRELSHVAFLS